MERIFNGLESFVLFLERQALVEEVAMLELARASSHVLHEKITTVMGDNTKLADLAPSTQAERVAQGYTPNDPLVRSGSLRDSFERFVGHDGGFLTAAVGSSDERALWHEFGMGNYPPRPAVKIGLQESEEMIEELIDMAVGVILGHRPTMNIVP